MLLFRGNLYESSTPEPAFRRTIERKDFMKTGRGIAILLALAFALGLSACGGDSTPPPAESQVNSLAEPSEPPVPPLEQDQLTVLLEDISEFEPDTAGSSLKLCQLGAKLLNFSETYEEGQEKALRAAVSGLLSQLEEEQSARLRENLPAVLENADAILEGGDDITALLNDAGNPQEYDAYTPERYQSVSALLSELLA